MKKTIMQSTIKLDGDYGVEIGEYAIVTSRGYIQEKWHKAPWGQDLELNQTDGKVEVTEKLLAEAETINMIGEMLARGWKSDSKMSKLEYVTMKSKDNEDSNPAWLLDKLEGPVDRDSPPSNLVTVLSTMSFNGKLGWEFFPNYYLFEDGTFASPYNPLPEGKIESADGEFTVDIYRYVDATSTAQKLGFIDEAEKLGIRGYID